MNGTSPSEVWDVTEFLDDVLTFDIHLRCRTPVEGLFFWSPCVVPLGFALLPHPGNDGLLCTWISTFITW